MINLYKTIQKKPSKLYSVFLKNFVIPYNNIKNSTEQSKFFYEVRNDFNQKLNEYSLVQCARFLFLNRTCYGGLFRTNSNGFFNVPFGFRKRPKFLTEQLLLNISMLIKNVQFKAEIFNSKNLEYEKGDFFYFDPPYVKMKKESFVNYSASGFSNDDFFSLTNFCKRLDYDNCFFSLSNSNNSIVLDFAKNYKTL